jgi:type VI secretion system protein ImpG
MDPRFLLHYNRELQFVRELGAEFAREYPKIAGRLGLEGFECTDPYVERLLEGFAFLAARVQLKLEAEFPRFTRHLLEAVYPHYLSPTPSMAVVRLYPDATEAALADGYTVARGTALRSVLGPGDVTACEYRTSQDVTLLPLELTEAEYVASPGALAAYGLPDLPGAKAGIRLRLRTTAGLTFDKVALSSLRLYLRGSEQLPMRLYELLVAGTRAVVVRPPERPAPWQEVLRQAPLKPVGLDDADAVLPTGPRSFQGYRLLHEYFAFPHRFLFVEIGGLAGAARRGTGNTLDLFVILSRTDTGLQGTLETSQFELFCTPAVNLFPKRADRIHLDTRQHEYHVLLDRTRPLDFEVYSVTAVLGHGTRADQEQPFRPLYSLEDPGLSRQERAYFSVHRERRMLSEQRRRKGPRSSYIGSEVFVSLVDADEAPYRSDLRQLSVETVSTNRDLPLQMPVGRGKTDFTLETGAPVGSVRIVAGPTAPRPSWAEGDPTWRLISHLSLNYLSLVNADSQRGAAGLRELLALYGDIGDAASRRQVEGVQAVVSRPITRRLPGPGPIAFGRGVEINVTCDESAFEGTGLFLLGSVLERFFARYVSINSFTETVLTSSARGELMRWPARPGQRHLL